MSRLLLLASVIVVLTVALAVGQPPQSKSSSEPIRAHRCRMTLFKDQPVAAGRSGVLEFVGGRVETGKDESGEPIYKIVEITEGVDVTEGEVVAQLVDDVADAAYRVAVTESENDVEIRFQKKATEVAQATHESALQANRKVANTFPEIDVKKLKLDAEKGLLATEQAEHQFRILKMKAQEAAANLDTYRIRAPFDGVITHILKSKGEAVREGDPIFEMANTKRVRVEGYVDPKQARKLKRGMKVLVQQELDTGGLESRSFEGQVLFVDVQLEKITLMQRVVAEVINMDDGLVAGRQATMTFVVETPAAASR